MTKDELVEKVALAIAIGCGLDPDAPSPKAAAAGHTIPEWHFFVPAARAALAIAMPAAFEMAAEVASWAHMVPPDGGSPSEAECLVAKNAAAAIRELGEKWK